MAEQPYQVHGKLQKIQTALQLVPSSEVPSELHDIPIVCTKKVGDTRVHAGLETTFLVEIRSDGKGHVVGISGSSPQSTAPAPVSPQPAKPSQASTVTPPQPTPPAALPSTAAHTSFIHPYNFVRLPSEAALSEAIKDTDEDTDGLFRRGPSAPHDRYDHRLHSGVIECELTTHTHWFIPDARKKHKPEPDGHATLGYFTLAPVDTAAWNKDPRQADETAPAIPGSSVRGMVRSIFETATLSCLSNLDDRRLQFRATRLLSDQGYQYVPARILKVGGGSAELQLLPSQLNRREVAGALHHCYIVKRDDNRDVKSVDYDGVLYSSPTLRSGTRVVAIVRSTPTPHPSPSYDYREATHVFEIPDSFPNTIDPSNPPSTPFLDDARSALGVSGNLTLFGYFFRTGWNIERKHDERVFFASGAYNAPHAGVTASALLLRLSQFLADQVATVTAQPPVVEDANKSLREYAERHKDRLTDTPRDPTSGKEPQLSDYVVAQPELREKDLVFALLDPNNKVIGLYPVCLPRVWHEHSIGDLRPPSLEACSHRLPPDKHDELCPACRVFGWTRFLKDPPPEGDSRRIDALTGHVRFTHATLADPWDPVKHAATVVTLPILGSPHPSCTEFYLQEQPGFSVPGSGREPPALKYVDRKTEIPAYPFAMYRKSEADLRGRKFSRRQTKTDPASSDPARAGLVRPRDDDHDAGFGGNQNQTVYLLPPDMKFRFHVYFDNLTDGELGALLFSLDLAAPPSWGGAEVDRLYHAIGHGTRLGMGRCSIAVRRIQVDEMDSAGETARYRQMSTILAPVCAGDTDDYPRARTAFSEAWQRLLDLGEPHGKEYAIIIRELADMLQIVNGPVHYPNRWVANMRAGIDYFDSFTWFVANKRGNKGARRRAGRNRLPLPTEESSGTKRLPTDPTEPDVRR